MSKQSATKLQGATKRQLSFSQRWFGAILQNFRQLISSLGELWRTPFSSIMTMMVLGVSLTLPVTLHVIVKNVSAISTSFDSASEISLFIKQEVGESKVEQLLTRLRLYPEIESVAHIDRTQALAEFKSLSGFGSALDYLDENPFPSVILVTPQLKHRNAMAAEALLNKLQEEKEVRFGKLDIEWLKRLNALLGLLNETVFVLGLLLLSAVILIIGNTIRLSIMSKRDQIEVMKLVGATDSFIQRPFLFTGFWYGLIGGFIAYIVVEVMLYRLDGAIIEVASLYRASFSLSGLDFPEFLALLAVSISLGLFGAFGSVQKFIAEMEPQGL